MFWFRETLPGRAGESGLEVAFTDNSLDLQGLSDGFADALARLEVECGTTFARANQVHGVAVHTVERVWPSGVRELDEVPDADGLVATGAGIGLMIRVADCVPVVLADRGAGVIGAAHAGRLGTRDEVVTRTVEKMRALGAGHGLTAWIGPHVCRSCYEVPDAMRAEVATAVPATFATTRQGTPGLDLGAGVRAQLDKAGVRVHEIAGCTMEEERLHSYRRDGDRSGRFAGLVWLR